MFCRQDGAGVESLKTIEFCRKKEGKRMNFDKRRKEKKNTRMCFWSVRGDLNARQL